MPKQRHSAELRVIDPTDEKRTKEENLCIRYKGKEWKCKEKFKEYCWMITPWYEAVRFDTKRELIDLFSK